MQSAYQVINEDVMARTVRGVVNYTRAMQDAAGQAAAAFEGFPVHNHHARAVTPAQRAAKRARGKAARQARATHRRK